MTFYYLFIYLFIHLFYYFSDKTRFDISCESKLSSAAIVIGALRVNIQFLPVTFSERYSRVGQMFLVPLSTYHDIERGRPVRKLVFRV